jgi:hypothetical protein
MAEQAVGQGHRARTCAPCALRTLCAPCTSRTPRTSRTSRTSRTAHLAHGQYWECRSSRRTCAPRALPGNRCRTSRTVHHAHPSAPLRTAHRAHRTADRDPCTVRTAPGRTPHAAPCAPEAAMRHSNPPPSARVQIWSGIDSSTYPRRRRRTRSAYSTCGKSPRFRRCLSARISNL